MEILINKEETIRTLITTGILEDVLPETLMRFIKKIDEINITQMVHCEKCQYWGNFCYSEDMNMASCDKMELMTELNGYCHRGKEK